MAAGVPVIIRLAIRRTTKRSAIIKRCWMWRTIAMMYRCQLLARVWFARCAAGLVPMRGLIGGNVRQFAYSEHLNHKQAMLDFKARRASQATSWTN